MFLYLSMIDEESDKEKFIHIYEEYHRLMLYVANQMLKDSGLAEDAVQESFISIAKNITKIQINGSKTKNLCVLIVKNKCIDLMRRQKSEEQSFDAMEHEMESEFALPVEMILEEEGLERLKSCIRQLGEESRTVFELRYFHEYSQKEIAEILGVSVKTVNMRLFRGKKKLREMLEAGGEQF